MPSTTINASHITDVNINGSTAQNPPWRASRNGRSSSAPARSITWTLGPTTRRTSDQSSPWRNIGKSVTAAPAASSSRNMRLARG